tara:strand:+ start:219 stop:608 length:390 start_codon:yes stop_codon:yes gene_type:complete
MKKLSLYFLIPFSAVTLLTSCSSTPPTIQKRLAITNSIYSVSHDGSNMMEWDMWKRPASKECLRVSIASNELDELLSSGVKVITSQQWKKTVNYGTEGQSESDDYKPYTATCIGITYVVEGPEKILEKY